MNKFWFKTWFAEDMPTTGLLQPMTLFALCSRWFIDFEWCGGYVLPLFAHG